PNPATYIHNPHTWTDPLGLSPCEINWSAKSTKTFGHTFKTHGKGHTLEQMADRARGKGKPQGQWLDDKTAAELMRREHRPGLTKAEEAYVVEIPKGLGRVVFEDGTW
ncbi:hypothetical protein AB4212_62145, partial [Streptomyces sp. 2MCAF27]